MPITPVTLSLNEKPSVNVNRMISRVAGPMLAEADLRKKSCTTPGGMNKPITSPNAVPINAPMTIINIINATLFFRIF